MNTYVERPFVKMGARIKFEELSPTSRIGPVQLDVLTDEKGEYFLIRATPQVNLQVLDTDFNDRHVLLLTRIFGEDRKQEKSRFLMGHDERHWFVAAVPESAPVSTVEAAKQALKPEVVVAIERGLRTKQKHLRANKACIRQGEWFFVPVPALRPNPLLVLKHEPLMRSGGKPHMADELYRNDGETVYVKHDRVITKAAFERLSDNARNGWRMMRRNMRVFVRGRIRHRDHATVVLNGWHEVFMNTETRARAMARVVFLD